MAPCTYVLVSPKQSGTIARICRRIKSDQKSHGDVTTEIVSPEWTTKLFRTPIDGDSLVLLRVRRNKRSCWPLMVFIYFFTRCCFVFVGVTVSIACRCLAFSGSHHPFVSVDFDIRRLLHEMRVELVHSTRARDFASAVSHNNRSPRPRQPRQNMGFDSHQWYIFFPCVFILPAESASAWVRELRRKLACCGSSPDPPWDMK